MGGEVVLTKHTSHPVGTHSIQRAVLPVHITSMWSIIQRRPAPVHISTPASQSSLTATVDTAVTSTTSTMAFVTIVAQASSVLPDSCMIGSIDEFSVACLQQHHLQARRAVHEDTSLPLLTEFQQPPNNIAFEYAERGRDV